jgi:hypothetical protein
LHNASNYKNIDQIKELYLDRAKKIKFPDKLTSQITKIFNDLIDDVLFFESTLISQQSGVICAPLDKFIEYYDKTKNDIDTELTFNRYVSIFPEYKDLKTLSTNDSEENKSRLIEIVRKNSGSYINKLPLDEILSACLKNPDFYKNICSFKQYYLSPKVKENINKVLLQYKNIMHSGIAKISFTEINELKEENKELKTKFNKYEPILEMLFMKQNTNSVDDDNPVELSGSQGGGEGEE